MYTFVEMMGNTCNAWVGMTWAEVEVLIEGLHVCGGGSFHVLNHEEEIILEGWE